MSTVIFHALPIPELDLSEALRYAGCKEDEQMLALAHSCYDMLKKSIATHKTINTEDKIKAAFEEIFGFLAFLWDIILL